MASKVANFLLLGIMWSFLFIQGCTYSVNLIHTQGVASDVLEEDQGAEADPDIKLPESLPVTLSDIKV
jgi:hypothetical protein